MGNKDCLNKAKENFASWMGMVEPDAEEQNQCVNSAPEVFIAMLFRIDVNLKYETYCSAISAGSQEEWDFAMQRYKNSRVASEKATILSSLSCTKEVLLCRAIVLLYFDGEECTTLCYYKLHCRCGCSTGSSTCLYRQTAVSGNRMATRCCAVLCCAVLQCFARCWPGSPPTQSAATSHSTSSKRTGTASTFSENLTQLH